MLKELVEPVVLQTLGELSRFDLSASVRESLRISLEARLCGLAESAFHWYYQTFLMTPGLRTRQEAELRKLFFQNGVEAARTRFLTTFPALDELWKVVLTKWLSFMEDFLQHTSQFAQRMGWSDDGQIFAITPDLSDSHHGGRTVVRVQFVNGEIWFYKPRSGKNEEAWFAMLGWLNDLHFPKPFRLLQVISVNDHCWMEAAEHRTCQQREEVAAFYYRAGALLYLYYRLGGIDLHCGNLIAEGENPVLIDCETLFHEAVTDAHFSSEVESSVLRCGMLPIPGLPGRIGVSALAPNVVGAQTIFLENQPMLARDFVDEIVAGFEGIHTFINSQPEVQLAFKERTSAMAQLQWRKILRPTSFYYQILQQSLSVGTLLKAAGRLTVLETLQENATLHSLEEIQSLQSGDIPFFYGQGYLGKFALQTTAESTRLIRQMFTVD